MSIIRSRQQRRQLERDNSKLPSALELVPRAQWPDPNAPLKAVWRSRDFLVQVYVAESPALARLSINRTMLADDRWVDGISWDDLQDIKNQCGFGSHDAVEIYPDARDVVNVANMRHLWILQEKLPFAWRRKGGDK